MDKRFLNLLFLLLTSLWVFAQLPELNVRNLNISENASGIEKARNFYDKGEYIMAEAMLYSELEKGNFKPNDFLLFANTLNVDNKPSLAKEFFKEYATASGNKNASAQIESMFSGVRTSFVAKSIETDFPLENPTMKDGKVYSAVGGRLMSYEKDCDGNLSNRKEVLGGVIDKPIGSASFFSDNTKAVVSVLEKGKSSLYFVYQKKGKWKKPVKLFSEVSGNNGFPFVDEASNTLYFSSDRANGFGGYDIYVSSISGKSFSSPINMGTEVNTGGNEINPTVTSDWLYLSSNGHISKGGYDLYKYKNLGDFNTIFVNCSDLNTQGNDLAIVPTSKNQFFVSRSTLDGIELVNISKPAIANTFTGNVIDEAGKPVNNASVLLNAQNGMGNFSSTNEEGKFIYRSTENVANYSGSVIADGYESVEFNSESSNSPVIQLIKVKPVEIIKEITKTVSASSSSGIVTAPTVGTHIEQEVSEVIIPETAGESEASSSRPDRGLYYIIIGSSYNYAQAYDFWNKWIGKFSGAEILEYGNGLYRIGYYAGDSEENAMRSFNEAKKLKKDIWILRPKN